MSRYYKLTVTPKSADGKTSSPTTWTNKNGDKAILNAQRIEFDLAVTTGATPAGGAWIRVWGPTREQIDQASDFNGASIEFYGGMQNGLPLATQSVQAGQPGLLISGTVFQAYANWQGTIQTLEFVIIPAPLDDAVSSDEARQAASVGAPPPPLNFSFTWKQGDSLTDKVQAVLRQAYPGSSVTLSAATDITLLHDEAGVFTDIRTFSNYVQGISRDIKGPTYAGLNITPNGTKSFLVFDNTKVNGSVTKVTMFDLIGQVTWLSAYTATFATVLRADINIGDTVTFPPLAQAQAITTADSQSQARTKNTFNGNWQVTEYVRHVGDSRSPDAQSWVSVFQAAAMNEGA
jgi:hypothetical protein